jgi:Spy/CpxP family protein refolding chaperone
MKKIASLVLVAALATGSAIAQDQKQTPQTPGQKPAVQQEQKDVKPAQDQKAAVTPQDRAAWEKKFKEDLKLTDEQSQKFDALNKEYGEKFEALGKDATLTADAQKAKKMDLKKEREGKLFEILTPDQQAKYKEWKESMEKKNSDVKQ